MEKQMYQPRKRHDLIELTDKVYKLKSAIQFKLELEKQIELTKKLLKSYSRFGLWDLLYMVFFYTYWVRSRYEKGIKKSELRSKIEVKEKQKNIYQRNEDFLEQEFKDIYPEMNDRYDAYLKRLKVLYGKYAGTDEKLSDLPVQDIEILHEKHRVDPPKTKTDKLSFYLTMEELLYRCQKG